MIVDIINTAYFKNTKLKSIFRKIILLLAPLVLLFCAIDWLFYSLEAYTIYRDVLIVIFTSIWFFEALFDTSLFTRIGKVEIVDHFLIIKHEEIVDRVDLTNTDKVTLKRVNYGFYQLTIKQHTVVIELNEYTKIKFKSILEKFNVKLN